MKDELASFPLPSSTIPEPILRPNVYTSPNARYDFIVEPTEPELITLNIIVIGAGIGGLTTAYLLGKAGHKVTVLESTSQLSEVGAGMQLSPNVTRLFRRWGAGAKLRSVAVVPQTLTLRRYANGEVVGWRTWGEAIEKEHGAPYYHVHRADLHQILVDLAKPLVNIRLNSRVVDIDAAAGTVTLASRRVLQADLIIGADGLHSRARDIVVGQRDRPIPTGDAAYRATIPAELLLADPDLRGLVEQQGVNVWMGPGRHVTGYCIRDKRLYNLVMFHPARECNEHTRDANLDIMKEDFANFEPRVRKLLDLVPTAMVWSLMTRHPLKTWIHQEGKLCLLGDACHPMLPYRAQGAAMAIEDAAVLANLLSRITTLADLKPLLEAYEAIRHKRATGTQTASRLNQHIFHLPDGPGQRARDASMRLAMDAAVRESRGEKAATDCVGNQNAWADREKNREAFDYDADVVAEKWWIEHRPAPVADALRL